MSDELIVLGSIRHALHNRGIQTLDELEVLSDKAILGIWGIRQHHLQIVREVLAARRALAAERPLIAA